MTSRTVPRSLIEKYGAEVFIAGLEYAERRRQEVFGAAGHDTVQERDKRGRELAQSKKIEQIQNIKIWPLVGLASLQRNKISGWRFWRLAHHFDKAGSGRVKRTEFIEYLKGLGVPAIQVKRWCIQAENAQLIKYNQRKDVFLLVSLGNAAVKLGCAKIGKPASIPINALLSKGWRAHVWAAFLGTLPPRPISREKLELRTGIHPRTQRRYEIAAGVEVRKNYLPTDISPEYLEAYKIHHNTSAAMTWTQKGGAKYIARRLPDIRLSTYQSAKRGRSKKAQKLVNQKGCSQVMQPECHKLFYQTRKGASDKASRVIEAGGVFGLSEVFYLSFVASNANSWRAIPATEAL